MGREIKFRAWVTDYDPDHNSHYMMIYFNAFNDLKESLQDEENSKIMQYTDMLDERGEEIYEGDIIVWEYSENPQEVFWDNSICGFSTKHYHLWRTVKKVKIIGNIYENPELLQKEETN